MNQYTSKQISEITGLTPSTLRDICLRKQLHKTKGKYIFSIDIWITVLLKKYRKKLYKVDPKFEKQKVKEVIVYIPVYYHIFESKINSH